MANRYRRLSLKSYCCVDNLKDPRVSKDKNNVPATDEQNNMLSACLACGSQVSHAAKQCMNCGHPVGTPPARKFWLFFIIALVALCLVGLAFVKTYPDLLQTSAEIGTKASSQSDMPPPSSKPAKIPKAALEKQLISFVHRINRLAPYKPNELVTLQRVRLERKPLAVIYEYEMNAAAGKQGVDLAAAKPLQMQRHCSDPDLALPATNNIPITWSYFKNGRLLHEHTISSCKEDLFD